MLQYPVCFIPRAAVKASGGRASPSLIGEQPEAYCGPRRQGAHCHSAWKVAAASESQSLPQPVPKSPLPNVGKAQYYFPVAVVQIITDLVV